MLSTLARAGFHTASTLCPAAPSAFLRRNYAALPLASRTNSLQPRTVNWDRLDATLEKTGDSNEKRKLKDIKSPDELWARRSQATFDVIRRPPSAYAGRSFPVTGGDVQAALNKVTSILRRNRVWQELRRTARHEKKGYKRRRLASQRWRTFFADAVRQKVRLVQEIRRRGA